MVTKQCSKCRDTKPLTEYHTDNARTDGKNVYCKDCIRTIRAAYADKFKVYRREYSQRPQVKAANAAKQRRRRAEAKRANPTVSV